jgi:hypothetical protein
MKLTAIDFATMDRMAALMRPEHYVGFLTGCAFLSLIQHPEPDIDSIKALLGARDDFVRRQRDAGEPTGNPVAPVYWTEEIGGYDDREELIACMPGGMVFSLHSSVEPHMEWVCRMPIGDGEYETETFPTQAAGEQAYKGLQEENKRQREIMLAEVRHLYSMGDIEGAENRMGMWDVEIQGPIEDNPMVMLVDGERIPIGPVAPLVPRAAEHHPV